MWTAAAKRLSHVAVCTKKLEAGRVATLFQPLSHTIRAYVSSSPNLLFMRSAIVIHMVDGQKSCVSLPTASTLVPIVCEHFCTKFIAPLSVTAGVFSAPLAGIFDGPCAPTRLAKLCSILTLSGRPLLSTLLTPHSIRQRRTPGTVYTGTCGLEADVALFLTVHHTFSIPRREI